MYMSGAPCRRQHIYSAMTFSYVLDGAGWASVTIAQDGRYRKIQVSYLSDPLYDIVQAAISLLEGAESVRFSFDDEPGEHRCIITRTGNADANIRVLWFTDLWSKLPDDQGEEVFNCACSVAGFCKEMETCLQHLFDAHGIDGYKKLWVGADFPSEPFDRLREITSGKSNAEKP